MLHRTAAWIEEAEEAEAEEASLGPHLEFFGKMWHTTTMVLG